MQSTSVLRIWTIASDAGLNICIDGGWAVDAVLGRQTRAHSDLDIALPAFEVPRFRQRLEKESFVEVPVPDSWEHNFVLQSVTGDLIDVHSYELHEDGRNKSGVAYCADHLRGSGIIDGVRVRCVPPEYLVDFHTGYEVDEKDWHDVKLLCEAFGLIVPDIYRRFWDTESKS